MKRKPQRPEAKPRKPLQPHKDEASTKGAAAKSTAAPPPRGPQGPDDPSYSSHGRPADPKRRGEFRPADWKPPTPRDDLRNARQAAGLTRDQAAVALRTTGPQIAGLEAGLPPASPDADLAERAAELYADSDRLKALAAEGLPARPSAWPQLPHATLVEVQQMSESLSRLAGEFSSQTRSKDRGRLRLEAGRLLWKLADLGCFGDDAEMSALLKQAASRDNEENPECEQKPDDRRMATEAATLNLWHDFEQHYLPVHCPNVAAHRRLLPPDAASATVDAIHWLARMINPDESRETAHLTETQSLVIRAMGKVHPRLLTVDALSSSPDIGRSDKTIREAVKSLIASGLTRRPGEGKTGAGLTPRGLQVYRQITG